MNLLSSAIQIYDELNEYYKLNKNKVKLWVNVILQSWVLRYHMSNVSRLVEEDKLELTIEEGLLLCSGPMN